MNRKQQEILSFLLIVILLIAKTCESANVLIFVLLCSYSQLNVHHPYAVRLTEEGHNVTMIMPVEYKTPNSKINYFVPKELKKGFDDFIQDFHDVVVTLRDEDIQSGSTQNVGWETLPASGVHLCDLFLNIPGVVSRLENSNFDLVIIDDLWNDCGLGLAYKFKAPFIYFITSPIIPSAYDTFGVIPENSWLPDIRRRWAHHMTFIQRVQNVLSTLEIYFVYKHFSGYFSDLELLLKSKLNIPDMPALADLERKASLAFVNSHFSMEVARSLPPFFVEVGGLQCVGKKSTLPEVNPTPDIAKFLDGFPKGFIYISFGTVVHLPLHKQNIFLQVFNNFPQIGFVMKWNGALPDNIPTNTLLLSFAPQQELLSHKNILGFVSHGGMLSTQEVTYYGVPILGMPVFAEQDYNVNNLHRRGAALKLELTTLTVEELNGAIYEMANNPRYKEAMKKISKLSHDRPQHPMDTAIWWTEYVLRNSQDGIGLDHLKPLSINQTWYQRRCLDVWGFIMLTIVVSTYLASKALSFTVKMLWNAVVINRKSKLE